MAIKPPSKNKRKMQDPKSTCTRHIELFTLFELWLIKRRFFCRKKVCRFFGLTPEAGADDVMIMTVTSLTRQL